MSADILSELAHAKALFQLRAIEAIIRGPASAIEARRAETQGGSVEDESAVANGETPTPSSAQPGDA